jgi:hypothetical protein
VSPPLTLPADLAELLSAQHDLIELALLGIAELAVVVDELHDLETHERAMRGRLGQPSAGPDTSELLVDVLHGQLRALRPHLPFVSEASAERAADALLSRGEGR